MRTRYLVLATRYADDAAEWMRTYGKDEAQFRAQKWVEQGYDVWIYEGDLTMIHEQKGERIAV